MAIVGVLSAIAYLLMFMEFSVPLMPVFIKMDLSDFPALIGSLAVGPAGGIIIALIKNLLHLTVTSTGGVGELSNFILNAVFILPAGLLLSLIHISEPTRRTPISYAVFCLKKKKKKKRKKNNKKKNIKKKDAR